MSEKLSLKILNDKINALNCNPSSSEPRVVKIKMTEGYEELLPVHSKKGDAGRDLKARGVSIWDGTGLQDRLVGMGWRMTLTPGKQVLIKTGVHIELPNDLEAQIRPRSGNALKEQLMVTNSPGTIDCNYRGEIGVILFNAGKNDIEIKYGDRIAQMVIANIPNTVLLEQHQLSDTNRGSTGFGDSGKR
jgi:dUTP pyrophosphatase